MFRFSDRRYLPSACRPIQLSFGNGQKDDVAVDLAQTALQPSVLMPGPMSLRTMFPDANKLA
jgi:hypothetical protein